MDEMKSNLLTPEILEECLNKESCFDVIKPKRDITLSLNSDDENKNSKYIGKYYAIFFLFKILFTHADLPYQLNANRKLFAMCINVVI